MLYVLMATSTGISSLALSSYFWLHQLFWIELCKSTTLSKQPGPATLLCANHAALLVLTTGNYILFWQYQCKGYKLLSSSLEPLGVIN